MRAGMQAVRRLSMDRASSIPRRSLMPKSQSELAGRLARSQASADSRDSTFVRNCLGPGLEEERNRM